MKTIAVTIISLLSLNSFAENNYQLICQGNRGKVAILFEKVIPEKNSDQKAKIRFTYTNQDGKKEFPIYEGVVTQSAMPYIKMASKELSTIDTKLILEWDLDQCKAPTNDPMIIACDGEAKVIFPLNSKLKSFDIFTSKLVEKTPTFTYEMFRLRIGLDSENMHYLATMPFDPANCFVNNPENFSK